MKSIELDSGVARKVSKTMIGRALSQKEAGGNYVSLGNVLGPSMADKIPVNIRTIAHVEIDASEINFDSTYQFEIGEGDRMYLWTGVKPERVGDIAVFDWNGGTNGLLVKMSTASRRFLP